MDARSAEDAMSNDVLMTGDENIVLRGELARLEELLADDENWQDLKRLKESHISAVPREAASATDKLAVIEGRLASNRIYRARCKSACW